MSEPQKKRRRRAAQPKLPPKPRADEIATTDPVTSLDQDVVRFALRMMLPRDLSLLFDVRLVDYSGKTLTRAFGSTTLNGAAAGERRSSLGTELESMLNALVVRPVMQEAQALMQAAMLADDARIDAAAPPPRIIDHGEVPTPDQQLDADSSGEVAPDAAEHA